MGDESTAPEPADSLARLRERLTRLEEAQLFSERGHDSFHEQVAALEQRLQETLTRLRNLEAGLGRLGEIIEDHEQRNDP